MTNIEFLAQYPGLLANVLVGIWNKDASPCWFCAREKAKIKCQCPGSDYSRCLAGCTEWLLDVREENPFAPVQT